MRGVPIAIVLVGLFMATRLFWLLGVGATLGLVALACASAACRWSRAG